MMIPHGFLLRMECVVMAFGVKLLVATTLGVKNNHFLGVK